ncbi:MAG: sensor histidine kinase [Firmicutes bacterium]|nr:sensor histidine kinase [Bacillota bacterium]
MAYYQLDPMIASLFHNDTDVQTTILFPNSGGSYVYKGYISQGDAIRNSQWYEKILYGKGQTVWVGLIPNPDQLSTNEKAFAVGRVIKDTAFRKNLEDIGVVVILLNENIFSSIYQDVEVGPYDMIAVMDEYGRLISQEKGGGIKDIWQHSFIDKILNQNQGYFRQKIDKEDIMITYSTSSVTGWKTIRMIPYRCYMNEIRDIGWMTLTLLIICLIGIYGISFLIARRISEPIRALSVAMRQVGDKNFQVSVPVCSNDEIGMISAGFNHMVIKLKNLFNRIVQEEQQKRKAQIRVLQYQINPHFLYNALVSIRMVAMMHHDHEVADMVLALNRLLRNTISKAGHMITVAEEIDNLKDYFTLQQVRYKNRILVEYRIEDTILSYRIPWMLLQPLAENAISHGLNDKLNGGDNDARIIIRGTVKGNYLLLEIEDNGRGIPEDYIRKIFDGKAEKYEDSGTHIGIKNTHDRIQLEFGNDYGISINSILGEYTRVTVRLPVISGSDKENDQCVVGG